MIGTVNPMFCVLCTEIVFLILISLFLMFYVEFDSFMGFKLAELDIFISGSNGHPFVGGVVVRPDP